MAVGIRRNIAMHAAKSWLNRPFGESVAETFETDDDSFDIVVY